MLSLTNSDTNNCVVYLENYLDCIDNLPDDLQRHLTRMRELDVSYQDLLQDIESLATQYEECISRGKSDEKIRLLTKTQSTLILAQELGDAKLQIVQQLQDLIENKTRSLDNDYRNIDNGSKEKDVVSSGSISSCVSNNASNVNNSLNEVPFKEQITVPTPASSSSNGNTEQRTSKRVRRGRGDAESNNEHNSTVQHHHHHHYSEHGGSIPMPRVSATLIINNQKKHNNNVNTTKKKKRQKKQGQRNSMQKEDSRSSRAAASNNDDDDDDDLSIDPDEPTYCLCDQVSYGEMICCDNDLCPIEWFHFSCVSLNYKPKGKWFCPKCRGDRPNVKKPKAQLEKELERYNREKEETARSY